MLHGRINSQTLAELYTVQRLSTYQIAERYNCDPKTVYFHLKKSGIETRKKKKINIADTHLRSLYLKKRESLARIGRRYGFSAAGILKKLKEYDIPRRSTSETNNKHKKRDFIGRKPEQAYLMGFRLGDLGVRRKGNLIYVSSSTTKEDQAYLIRNLFHSYGPIWESKKNKMNGAWNVSCSLNESFNFLLPKYKRIPLWIMQSPTAMLSFIAGYTDAEGNFQIAGGTARFRLRSYDVGLLRDMHHWFTRRRISHLFYLESKAGIDRRGTKQNQDCWCLAVNTKEMLHYLLDELLPLLRHKKRRRDARLALANVKRRML